MDIEVVKRRLQRWESPFPLLVLLLVTIPWGIYLFQDPSELSKARWFGITAVFFFAFAFALYICLLAIRKMKLEQMKPLQRKLVLFTRKFIRFHASAAMIGTFWITLHVLWMMHYYSLNSKSVTGLLTLVALLSVLFTGYLRKQKSSGKRRRFHRYMTFLFIFFVMTHLLT